MKLTLFVVATTIVSVNAAFPTLHDGILNYPNMLPSQPTGSGSFPTRPDSTGSGYLPIHRTSIVSTHTNTTQIHSTTSKPHFNKSSKTNSLKTTTTRPRTPVTSSSVSIIKYSLITTTASDTGVAPRDEVGSASSAITKTKSSKSHTSNNHRPTKALTHTGCPSGPSHPTHNVTSIYHSTSGLSHPTGMFAPQPTGAYPPRDVADITLPTDSRPPYPTCNGTSVPHPSGYNPTGNRIPPPAEPTVAHIASRDFRPCDCLCHHFGCCQSEFNGCTCGGHLLAVLPREDLIQRSPKEPLPGSAASLDCEGLCGKDKAHCCWKFWATDQHFCMCPADEAPEFVEKSTLGARDI